MFYLQLHFGTVFFCSGTRKKEEKEEEDDRHYDLT